MTILSINVKKKKKFKQNLISYNLEQVYVHMFFKNLWFKLRLEIFIGKNIHVYKFIDFESQFS